ncbi:uncharacterized protein LOC110465382 [Mizuhopecten yessoensis]|nr:uncharacterized protein LOC110465382 [Mizuhopecten yessoensis]
MAVKESSNWNPWELFRESPKDLKNTENRKALRTVARAEWVKKKTSPYSSGTGYIFDPSVQRHIAARVTRFQHFSVTNNSISKVFLLYILPISLTCYVCHKYRVWYVNGIDSGEIPPSKQPNKFMW